MITSLHARNTVDVGSRTRPLHRAPVRAFALAATLAMAATSAGFGVVSSASADAYSTGTIHLPGNNPSKIAFTPDGATAFVADYSDAAITVLDVASHAVISKIQLENTAAGITVSPDGSKLYVTMMKLNAIAVIDTRSLETEATVPLTGSPNRVAFSRDGKTAYVSTDLGLSYVDVATAQETAAFSIFGQPVDVAVSPDGKSLYTVDGDHPWLAITDIQSHKSIRNVTVGAPHDRPDTVTFTPDGKLVLTTFFGGGVAIFDVATDTRTAEIPLAGHTNALSLNPSGTRAYVTGVYEQSIAVISVSSGTIESTITPADSSGYGYEFGGSAVSPDGTQVFLTNQNAANILVVSPLEALALSPESSSVVAGSTVTFTAKGLTDTGIDLGTVHPAYTADDGATVNGDTVTFTRAGSHTVTASFENTTATATVTVTPAATKSLKVTPGTSSVAPTAVVTFASEGFDRYGNDTGPLNAVYATDNGTDQVDGDSIRFFTPGRHTVTATSGSLSGVATVTVS